MNTLLLGDCVARMREIEPDSVQCCITSPPYFGLRDYGHAGQIGRESSVGAYVEALVGVFREVRRVLRDDGTLWLNIGDSYASGPKGNPGARGNINGGKRDSVAADSGTQFDKLVAVQRDGLKPKDLIGIPWRVALALQSDGWWLRQDIIWHKPNPMPESVTDRCTKAHEYLFLLAKSESYLCDMEAIKEPAIHAGAVVKNAGGKNGQLGEFGATRGGFLRPEGVTVADKRNRRSVWTITTKPYKGAHFATFPEGLVEPCVLAGSRAGDLVLDPFTGSGTTLAVASRHGRRGIGCELNEDYARLAIERLGVFGLSVRRVA